MSETGKKIKKAASVILNVLLWVLLAISILLVLLSALSRLRNQKGVGLFGVGLYQIVSGSMTPEVKIGDVIVGVKTDFDDLKVGQNIIFYDGARDIIITHKIIEIGNGFVTTHGIANPAGANETVAAEDIIARQVLRLPGLGYVLDFLRSPAGFFLIILVPLGGLIIYQSVSLSRRLKAYKAENAEQNTESEGLKREIDELKSRLAQGGSPENAADENAPTKTADAEKGNEVPNEGESSGADIADKD